MVENEPAVRASREAMVGAPIPVASMVESIVGCKWSVRLLQLRAEGQHRPSEFLRACPGLSAKVMNERLRKMTRFGIMERTVFGAKPPFEVEYALTRFGQRFQGILEEVRRLQEAVDEDWSRELAAREAGAGRATRLVASCGLAGPAPDP